MNQPAHAKGLGFDSAKLIGKFDKELHLKGYNFCGPNTRLRQRLERGDQPINGLDEACLSHDLAYDKFQDLTIRHKADKILQKNAWNRVKSRDASWGERISAIGVAAAMKLKRRIGAGLRKKRNKNPKKSKKRAQKVLKFQKLIKVAAEAIPQQASLGDKIKKAILVTKNYVRNAKGRKNLPKSPSRIIPIPEKTGGFLPALVPILAALGGVGGLATGVSSVMNTINNIKTAKKQLEEQKRHNLSVEGKMVGSGLYLKPYKKGYGLYLNPYEHSTKN